MNPALLAPRWEAPLRPGMSKWWWEAGASWDEVYWLSSSWGALGYPTAWRSL